MKKNIIKSIALLLVFTFIIGSVFSMSGGVVEADDSHSKTPFKYPITPESPEWKNYGVLELKKMLDIPLEEVEKMDTKTLLNVVLDYPYLVSIYAFNDPIKALDFLAEQFNGLKVLLKREDFKDELFNNYMRSSDKIKKLKDGEKITHKESTKHDYREVMLTYPTVLNKLTEKEKNDILSNSKIVAAKIDNTPMSQSQLRMIPTGETNGYEFFDAGDVIKSDYVKTPEGLDVYVVELEDFTYSERMKRDAGLDAAFPNAQRVRPATKKYNCHSYAWYSQSIFNTWWMDWRWDKPDYRQYFKDRFVEKRYNIEVGYKIYYETYMQEHSGIVDYTDGTYENTYIISKWGDGGLYIHKIEDCPYVKYVDENPNKSFWEVTM